MEIPAKHHLEYYASQFDTVELNSVFYRSPRQSRSGVGVINRAPLRLRLEGVEVHHPLETLGRRGLVLERLGRFDDDVGRARAATSSPRKATSRLSLSSLATTIGLEG
jgi:hypothetical protein